MKDRIVEIVSSMCNLGVVFYKNTASTQMVEVNGNMFSDDVSLFFSLACDKVRLTLVVSNQVSLKTAFNFTDSQKDIEYKVEVALKKLEKIGGVLSEFYNL